ncbi:MAG: HAD family hydrolase [Blastomonas sp.]
MSGRPLLVTDCDEVLLHMVTPFRDWLHEEKNIEFRYDGADFSKALVDRSSGETVAQAEIWALLNGFFDGQMHRQGAIAGAVESISRISEVADVVILTNLLDHRQQSRSDQLRAHGIDFPVVCNQGPKGEPLRRILDEYRPAVALFIDDLPQHHQSAAEHAPECWRLHMIGEVALAPHVACAEERGHAHARIDDWDSALPWILARLEEGVPAPLLETAN